VANSSPLTRSNRSGPSGDLARAVPAAFLADDAAAARALENGDVLADTALGAMLVDEVLHRLRDGRDVALGLGDGHGWLNLLGRWG
jgi:hypothetical protein